ncbi:MAG: hypothetical protein WCJ47_10060, partial [Methanomicrobiales archaeon]
DVFNSILSETKKDSDGWYLQEISRNPAVHVFFGIFLLMSLIMTRHNKGYDLTFHPEKVRSDLEMSGGMQNVYICKFPDACCAIYRIGSSTAKYRATADKVTRHCEPFC